MSFDVIVIRSECLGMEGSLFDAAALHSGIGEDMSAQRTRAGQMYRSKVVASGVEVYKLKRLGYQSLKQV